ncbi:MAG: CinA family protein [Rhodospirillales bacterium]|nr:CinA family protein [Rhodospirillales bacterium]
MFDPRLIELAGEIIRGCQAARRQVTTAESCTGGLVAACLTEVPGASMVIERGFVTYGNRAKQDLLGVSADLLEARGAVCEEVARAMAEGALSRADADFAIAITGIAGPGGGSRTRPVGLVHMAAAGRGAPTHHRRHVFGGDRSAIRLASVEAALTLLRDCVDQAGSDEDSERTLDGRDCGP